VLCHQINPTRRINNVKTWESSKVFRNPYGFHVGNYALIE